MIRIDFVVLVIDCIYEYYNIIVCETDTQVLNRLEYLNKKCKNIYHENLFCK